MTFNLSEILKNKQALRDRLAALSIADKLRLLDKLRERSLTIAASRKQFRRLDRQDTTPRC
jgi:hypothetical protein